MGKMLDSTLSWIFEKMAKAYVHRTGSNLPDAKVPVVQEVDGKPYFNLSSIGSADLAKLSGANGIDGTIAEAISGLKANVFEVYRFNVSSSQNGTKIKIVFKQDFSMFSGFLFGRRTLSNSFCLYHVTGYGEGSGRYNATDLTEGEGVNLIKSVDTDTFAYSIKFELIPSQSIAYFAFVNCLSINSVESISIEES